MSPVISEQVEDDVKPALAGALPHHLSPSLIADPEAKSVKVAASSAHPDPAVFNALSDLLLFTVFFTFRNRRT